MGPDGFKPCWRDLRKEKYYFSNRNFGGGSVTVWVRSVAKELFHLLSLHQKRKQQLRYCDRYTFIAILKKIPSQKYAFQLDNASIHISFTISQWFSTNHIQLLKRTARSPDLNPTENLWGIFVREIYDNNKQFHSTDELKAAILNVCSKFDEKTTSDYVHNMNIHIF